MFDTLRRTVRIVAQAAADTSHFVRSHHCTRAGAAYQEGAISTLVLHLTARLSYDIRKVHRIRAVRTAVDNAVPLRLPNLDNVGPQAITCMVIRYGKPH